MKIVISNRSELPIYAQITEQLREQILSGQIAEGAVLPSIRQLAKELGVSVITTTRAYKELEESGFIVSVQGKGSIVLGSKNDLVREQYLKRMEEHLEQAILTGRQIQLSDEEIQAAFITLLAEGCEF